MKELWPEQTKARHIANTLLNKGISSAYVSPCGTGKTVVAAAIISDRVKLGEIIFFLVPQIEIMNQCIDEFVEWNLDPGYINDEGIRGANRRVYVCMYQSLINLLPVIPESLYPDTLIIDELQHTLSTSIKTICNFFGSAVRLGLTATLYHASGETFKPYYTESFQTLTKEVAIEKGYITKPILIVPKDLLSEFEIPIVGSDYDMNVQAELLGETKIVGDIIKTYENLFCGKPVIIPCATYIHAEKITEMFNKAGWNFEHLHSELPKYDRKRILKGIENQTINGCCTVGIGVEGLSISGLAGVMWCCKTLSPIKWTQFNGRGERLYPDKKMCLIVDFVGNVFIHGMPDKERKWKLEGKDEQIQDDTPPYKTCPNCGVYNAEENIICHWCGYDLTFIPLDGTCGKCKNHTKDPLNDMGFCDELGHSDIDKWMIEPGCPYFMRRGRQLPTMIDGELVAITTDGQIHDISQRVRRKKDEQKQLLLDREESRNTLEVITEAEKRKVLKDGVFSDDGRRRLFKEAIRGMM